MNFNNGQSHRTRPGGSAFLDAHTATAERSRSSAGTPEGSRNIDVRTVVTVKGEPQQKKQTYRDADLDGRADPIQKPRLQPPVLFSAPLTPDRRARSASPSRLWACIPTSRRRRESDAGVFWPSQSSPITERAPRRLASEVGQLRTTVQRLERRLDELEDSLDSVGGRLLEALSLLGKKAPDRSLSPAGPESSLLEKGAGRHGEGPAGREEEPEPFPEGGKRAWLVAAGAAGLLFSTMGLGNSFGVFQAYYEGNQLSHHSAGQIAWIGSTQAFLMFAGGFLGGPMSDRYGASWVIPPAAFTYLLALMLTSLCTQYYQFILAQGILTGLSQGFLIFPAMAAVAQYFERRRGAALGLVVAGASLGAVVMPIALSAMLDPSSSLGYGWTLRILGFIVLPLLVFASLAVRARLPPRRKRLFVWAAFRNARFLSLVAAFVFVFLGMFTPLFYIPLFAQKVVGMHAQTASYLVAVVNGASFFGRVGPGLLADRYGRLNVLAAAAVCTGAVTLCWTLITTTAGMVVFCILFGFFSGAIVSGGSVVFAITADSPRNIGTYMGMGMPLASVAQLIGPPINGAFLARQGIEGFFNASIFSGVMCIVGGLVVIFVKTKTSQGVLGLV